MKIIHTADWHIGKVVNEISMLEDQKYILNRLVQCLKEEKPDALVIAGDLYDRSVPPARAVELLDKYLDLIIGELKIPVLAIAGNHDSGERLNFMSSILKKQGFHIVGEINDEVETVTLNDTDGEVDFYLIPYGDPAVIREVYSDEAVKNHEDAMKKIIESINLKRDMKKRAVVVAHGYVTNMSIKDSSTREELLKESNLELSDSERPLSIGGTDIISGKVFEGFNYVALGHLHGPQKVGSDKIRYSGSLLKYSFSEERQNKSITIVNINKDGEVDVELKDLKPLRNMRVIRGKLKELTKREFYENNNCDDYVFALLTDEGDLHEPISTLRAVYPNIMGLRRDSDRTLDYEKIELNVKERQKSKIELFKDFYENVTEKEIDEDSIKLMIDLIEEVGE
ncbi:MAG: exonuclease SbcCD subunit D [Sarcina sp.]